MLGQLGCKRRGLSGEVGLLIYLTKVGLEGLQCVAGGWECNDLGQRMSVNIPFQP